jgi:hypothetical protein
LILSAGGGARHSGFAQGYARAQALQAHAWGDELAELADDDSIDPQVRRVKFDIRRWLMSKTAPMHYGDKLTVAGDPAAPLLHVHQLDEILSSMSDRELAALESFAQARLAAIEAQQVDDAVLVVAEITKSNS